MSIGCKPAILGIAGLLFSAAVATVATEAQAPSRATAQAPTFTKDVAPILQRSCQNCHRPNSIAPMSLLTYEDARPWARSIKTKTESRDMPPWFIDRTIGINKFKNDISLTDEEVATISKWVDAGAPRGNPADMPPSKPFPDITAWQSPNPDLIVTMDEPKVVSAAGPDWWGNITTAEAVTTEDRWIKSVEAKPIQGYRAVHHIVASIAEPDDPNALADSGDAGGTLTEYSIGKNGDSYEEGTARLLPAGSKINFNVHLHSIGEDTATMGAVAFHFYPKGYQPKYVMRAHLLGGDTEQLLDIPANTDNIRLDTYVGLAFPTVITQFEPHMHNRGKGMCLEAIYPPSKQAAFSRNGGTKSEVLSCVDRFNFGWVRAYVYADDVAPVVPAGTILHMISWHNNSPTNKINYDPTNWIGFGNRTIDDMSHMWLGYYNISEDEYKQRVAAKQTRPTQQQ
jgi:hypothetical protein